MQIYLFRALIKQIIRYFPKVVDPREALCPQMSVCRRQTNFIPKKMQQ